MTEPVGAYCNTPLQKLRMTLELLYISYYVFLSKYIFLPVTERGIPIHMSQLQKPAFLATTPARYIILLSILWILRVFAAEPTAMPRSCCLQAHCGPLNSSSSLGLSSLQVWTPQAPQFSPQGAASFSPIRSMAPEFRTLSPSLSKFLLPVFTPYATMASANRLSSSPSTIIIFMKSSPFDLGAVRADTAASSAATLRPRISSAICLLQNSVACSVRSPY